MSKLAAPRLAGREVHVWTLPLLSDEARSTRALALLPGPDRLRARRMRAGEVRRRWTASRLALRDVLGGYLGRPGHELEFVDSGNGKPALAAAPGESPPCFNLSHSGDFGLLALTRAGDIGVDIERLRHVEDRDAIVARFFSAAECSRLAALPASRRARAFFECWTRKEALLKATGEGIGAALAQVVVSFGDDAPARILAAGGRLGDSARWTLCDLAAPDGYVAALAVRHPGPLLVRRFDGGADA